ncbi:MAG TPA: DUF5667 domain-containing protein [Dehalococcoidales bacterium]|nr:DUF5667 domain-containing protein [Dehalococcoidales bacterium]
MNQQETLNEIFNNCLDRLLKGESIDRILSEYPAFSRELEPMLRTAEHARVFSQVQPRDEFKARARYEFLSAARDLESSSQRIPWFRRRLQPVWSIGLAVAAVMVITGSSLVAASASAMPGQALYTVKMTTEKVQLMMAFSDITKTELNARFANRRSAEIEFLASAGNFEQIQMAATKMNTNLSNISALALGDLPATEDASTAIPKAAVFNAAQTFEAEPGKSPVTAPATGKGENITQPALAPAPPAPDATTTPTTPVRAPQPAAMAPAGSASPEATDMPLTVSAASRNQNTAAVNQATLSKYDKMRQIIEENYKARQARLQAALEKAGNDVRPAIRQAIADSEVEYRKALQNLEQAQNLEQNTNRGPE